MTRKLTVLLLLAVLASGCAASRTFRKGQDAVLRADWDTAVSYFTEAVQSDPDNREFKVHLRRAQEEASRMHLERARDFEQKDQLDMALAEYKKSLDIMSSDRIAQAKAAELERKIRERIEATRPKPRIDQLRTDAQRLNAPPLLNPASREPIRLNFGTASSLKDILNFIGTASGINVTYDQQYVDKPYSVNLDGVTVEDALQQVLSANGYYYKVTNPRTILVIPDQPAKHQQYDELVVKVFFISHSDATELAQLVQSVIRIPQMAVQPMMMPNKIANTITVRATGPVVDVIERIIRANDKPRAEVVLDIEILEVNRTRVKRYGIDLSHYALGLLFSPELAPPNTGFGGTPPPPPPLFNLNTISQGVSTADFYLGVPSAVVNFLQSDNTTKTLAKPQLRGQEGQALTLNLGQEVPVLSTTFGAPAAGGLATVPTSSYSYKPVGINLAITTRVTYEGEIVLDLSVENNAIGAPIDVGGQSALSFTSRKVHTFLRLREGEANLLAGLINNDNTKGRTGVLGLSRIPGLGNLFGRNEITNTDTDIVMLITPHIVRDHELTTQDVGSVYIGTQANVGLSGPPQLIAPQQQPEPQPPAAGTIPPVVQPGQINPAPAGVPGPPVVQPGQVNPAPAGVPGPPIGAPGGVPPLNPPGMPGTAPVPSPTGTAPVPGIIPPGQPAAPTTPPVRDTPPPVPPAGGTPTPPATAAQIVITSPPSMTVASGPYTVPISINNASRLSTITLAVTYNPAVLRVRTVSDGTFMRQGGVTASFTPRPDANAGRVDITIARAGDQTGASGAGLLAALLFDAIAPGTTTLTIAGVASAPDGTPLPLNFSPVSVTVR
jgi:general secretion pathway protein D